MTPERFRYALTVIRWSHRGLADALGCDDRLTRRWASGDAPIPEPVAAWLEGWAVYAECHPAPQGWKTR